MLVSLQALSTLGFSGPCDEKRLLGLQGGTGPPAVGCRLVPPRPDTLAAEKPEDVGIKLLPLPSNCPGRREKFQAVGITISRRPCPGHSWELMYAFPTGTLLSPRGQNVGVRRERPRELTLTIQALP